MLTPSYIDLVNNGPRPAWQGYVFFAVALGAQILLSLFDSQAFFVAWSTGARIRSILISLIYKKSLKLAPNKGRDTGAITNLVNTDAQIIAETIGFVISSFLAPFQIAACVALLARQLGAYAAIPVGAFLIAMPIGGIFGRRLGLLRLKIQAITDKRVRKVKELINANRSTTNHLSQHLY
jgi:ATP-binding cassette, subfamily C (CFTR/MRP), member 1